MRHLNGADRYQLYMESRTHHQHTLKVLVLDPSELRAPLGLERLRGWAEERLGSCAPLRWQIAALPGSRPVWVDNPHFDLTYHVNREIVPEPGGREEFADLLARLKETKLDRSRPLWRLWLVEGRRDGQIALVWSLHHALTDGGGTVSILEDIFDHEPTPAAEPPPVRPGAEQVPPPTVLVGSTLRGVMTRTVGLPRLLARTARAANVSRVHRRSGGLGSARPFETPLTPFGLTITARRTVASASVSMDDVAAVRRATGATVNDVFLALAAGALTSYLRDHGWGSTRSLTAGMPVSIRGPDDAGTYGNLLSTWFVSLATDIADPVARLAAISRATQAVRAHEAARRSERLQLEWMEYPLLFKGYLALGNRTTLRAGRPPYSVILSSVRGPVPLWFDGAAVTEIQSYSQLAVGIGLNITAWTYRGRLTAGFVACPEHVRDLWNLADRWEPAMAELLAAVAAHEPVP
jgi:WS/DGAT/MGAT family acyltransferase